MTLLRVDNEKVNTGIRLYESDEKYKRVECEISFSLNSDYRHSLHRNQIIFFSRLLISLAKEKQHEFPQYYLFAFM